MEYNDPDLRANSTLWIVLLSLTASIFTITDKYIWMKIIFRNADMDFECCEWPCMNPRLVLRALSLVWTIYQVLVWYLY